MRNVILQEPWFVEFKEEGILRTGLICLHDADRIKHIADDRAQKIITQEFIDDIEVMKKCYAICALEMCERLTASIRDPIVFCFSGKSSKTFRYHIGWQKEYKGNRKKNALNEEEDRLRHSLMNHAMEAIMKEYVCLFFDDLEADDLLCMLQCSKTYIHSVDKDLLQVPGWHYNHEEHKLKFISEKEAVYFLAKQLLTGDNTDCIPGIEGIGPAKAEKILSGYSPNNLISAVYKEYRKKYGIVRGTDLFASNWNLIKMRECHGEHFKNKYASAFSLVQSLINNLNN